MKDMFKSISASILGNKPVKPIKPGLLGKPAAALPIKPGLLKPLKPLKPVPVATTAPVTAPVVPAPVTSPVVPAPVAAAPAPAPTVSTNFDFGAEAISFSVGDWEKKLGMTAPDEIRSIFAEETGNVGATVLLSILEPEISDKWAPALAWKTLAASNGDSCQTIFKKFRDLPYNADFAVAVRENMADAGEAALLFSVMPSYANEFVPSDLEDSYAAFAIENGGAQQWMLEFGKSMAKKPVSQVMENTTISAVRHYFEPSLPFEPSESQCNRFAAMAIAKPEKFDGQLRLRGIS